MPDAAAQQVWHPRHNPWLITLTVMMAVFMEVLDTSIANIALPHIAGGLSATPEEPTRVIARILQGLGGGAMVPIAQAIMLESFPPQKRGAAMAVFAQGVVVAPILGPTLGGWITDSYSWRWIFYINVPVGIFAVLMAKWVVEEPPYI